MNVPRTSLYDQHLEAAMQTPTPTLERTSAEIRDRAVSEANVLRQENAELRETLREMHAAYLAEREALYDSVTNLEGEYDEGPAGDENKQYLAEMDAILNRAASLLARVCV